MSWNVNGRTFSRPKATGGWDVLWDRNIIDSTLTITRTNKVAMISAVFIRSDQHYLWTAAIWAFLVKKKSVMKLMVTVDTQSKTTEQCMCKQEADAICVVWASAIAVPWNEFCGRDKHASLRFCVQNILSALI
jgi:hypothetical protein